MVDETGNSKDRRLGVEVYFSTHFVRNQVLRWCVRRVLFCFIWSINELIFGLLACLRNDVFLTQSPNCVCLLWIAEDFDFDFIDSTIKSSTDEMHEALQACFDEIKGI